MATLNQSKVVERYRLQTLDRFALFTWNHEEATWVNSGLPEKPCALVAHLIWVGAPVSRSTLARMFWDDFAESLARNSLRQALFKIRTTLGEHCLRESHEGIAFALSVEADLAAFSRIQPGPETHTGELAHDLLRFARRTSIRSRDFDAWVARVRSSGNLLPSDMQLQRAASNGRDSEHMELEVNTALGLLELWQRSAPGMPISVWIPNASSREVRQGVDFMIAHCREHGGLIAEVRVESQRYRPFALEHTLASVLWGMPGAAGVSPLHRELLRGVKHDLSDVSASVLTTALLDLISAVAEDSPLLIALEEPEVYSRGALRSLIHGIAALKACPVLLLVLARSGTAPPAPLYYWRPSVFQSTV